jgi:hypothetical protein
MEDLSEVQDAIKAKYGEAIPVAAALIQLYTNSNKDQLITDLDDITPENTPLYYQKLTQGGSCVVIGTSPPPSGQPRENSNTLSSVDASQLTVYKDRLLQVALEEDSLVSGLGSSKKDAIFVRIPIMHTPGL